MARTVAAGPVTYTLALQFFVDEATTPIEDASRDWPEDVAPFVDVATLTIARQDVAAADGQALAARLERTRLRPVASARRAPPARRGDAVAQGRLPRVPAGPRRTAGVSRARVRHAPGNAM
jgi:hypothetical protein